MKNNYTLEDLSEFIRIKLTIFASFLAMIGYLLFNLLSSSLIFVMLSSFFITVGTYAYNNMHDKEEDLINKRKISYFVLNNTGWFIIIVCFLLGFIFSLFLSIVSILFCISIITTGIIYSFFGLKKYFLVKNLYTGFGIPQLFLLGAMSLNSQTILYYFLISIFFFTASLISDLRDYEGDRIVGIKTLPVYLGYNVTRKIIYILLIIILLLISALNLYYLFPISIFVLIIFFFIVRNNPRIAHFSSKISLLFWLIWLTIV